MTADIATIPIRPRKRRLLRWFGYFAARLGGLLLALVGAGAIYEAIESHRDRQLYFPRTPRRYRWISPAYLLCRCGFPHYHS